MAGDWIKMEHATADKPEVLRIADLLGCSRREVIGLLFDFWIWLDRNVRNGDGVTFVTHMSKKSLDEVTHCPGFAACLVDVGWATIDENTSTLTITNGSRHNGAPAKSRALGKDRAANHRNASVTRDALPEKRREEKRNTTTIASNIAFDAGAWTGITGADLNAWRTAYPAVDVERQIAAAAAWVVANPKNHKSNWRRFLNGWLARAQDNARPMGGGEQQRRVAL